MEEKTNLDSQAFLNLLASLVNISQKLQNNPPKLIPQEELASEIVLTQLQPYIFPDGPLKLQKVCYETNRPHLLFHYPANCDTQQTLSFVGSHFDVVPADSTQWSVDPFKLKVDGDKLYGRGVTDCLGHVALLTLILKRLCTEKIKLNDEESGSSSEIGVERLEKDGYLNIMKNGPLLWVDCADIQPNIGSGGVIQWELVSKGKCFHSGFPHLAYNALEFSMDIITYIQKRFYETFPPHVLEPQYGFVNSSSLKPTQFGSFVNGINQIPGESVLRGDIRVVPFYRMKDVMKAVESFVSELQKDQNKMIEGQRGPDSKYSKATFDWKWLGEPIEGLACSLDSPGFKALESSVKKAIGHCKPIADTGGLPLVGDLKEAGFDIQTIGFGVEDAYHSDDEFAYISGYEKGWDILWNFINYFQ